jgi:hypothetical protein
VENDIPDRCIRLFLIILPEVSVTLAVLLIVVVASTVMVATIEFAQQQQQHTPMGAMHGSNITIVAAATAPV